VSASVPAGGRPPTDRELRLRALRRDFLVEAEQERRELERLLGSAPAGDDARRARKLAHDLRGSGGSYGFPGVSAAAGALEDALNVGAPVADLAPLVRALDEALSAASASDGAP
jgi:HPt (histidine-containing phosphotransfer) domain-containing protein